MDIFHSIYVRVLMFRKLEDLSNNFNDSIIMPKHSVFFLIKEFSFFLMTINISLLYPHLLRSCKKRESLVPATESHYCPPLLGCIVSLIRPVGWYVRGPPELPLKRPIPQNSWEIRVQLKSPLTRRKIYGGFLCISYIFSHLLWGL